MKPIYLVVALAITGTPSWALDNSAVTVTPVMTTNVTSSGQPIVLPKSDARVIVSTYVIQPGAKLPEHKHLHPRYGYMQSGTLRVFNIDTGKSELFKTGDFIVEAIDQWHRAENAGDGPVRLLVIDQIESSSKEAGNVVAR